MHDDERESLQSKIALAESVLASLRAETPRRENVIAAVEMVIADAKRELAGDPDRGGATA